MALTHQERLHIQNTLEQITLAEAANTFPRSNDD